MKSILSFAVVLALASAACGQQTVAQFNWKELPGGPPRGTTAVSLDGRDALKIESTNENGLETALLTIEKPKISSTFYVVQGEVRYDVVQGDGFLEMWNNFPPSKPGEPDSQYFSRTLGDSGEIGKVRGTSDWRPFRLPFNSAGAPGAPIRLQINLHLPGRGTVWIGPLALVQYPAPAETPAHASHPGYEWFFGNTSHPWWSNTASFLASTLGTLWFLCVGLVIGLLAYKGKSRALVIGLLNAQIALGVLSSALAVTAFARHQPFWVWFPLSLFGFLLILINAVFLFSMDKWYCELELRRMQSLDVG